MHSKTPVVVVGGVEQRFCQQCSRFHLLVEFDEVKRSCRKRLDGHNRRRRKPQPDSISSANLFLIQQGARFSTYSLASQTHPVQHNWAGILKEEYDAPFSFSSPISSTSNQQHVPGSFFQRYKEGEPITLIQDNKTVGGAAVEQSTYQPSVKTLSSEISQSRIFSDGINLDSDCALSLLSSPADGIPMGQPYVLNFQYSRLEQYPVSQASRNLLPTESSSGLQEEQVGVLVCDTDADLQCQSMFHVGGESSSDGPSESLPFSWH